MPKRINKVEAKTVSCSFWIFFYDLNEFPIKLSYVNRFIFEDLIKDFKIDGVIKMSSFFIGYHTLLSHLLCETDQLALKWAGNPDSLE